MATRKKQEDTFIDQLLYPKLDQIGIDRKYVKRNVSTSTSGMLRGDLWIADVPYNHPSYEKRIIALIECKDRSSTIDDKDWKDAKRQGQEKAKKHGLKSFFVTNTDNQTRCYNSLSLEEILIDSNLITEIQSLPILRAIQTQVNKNNSNVLLGTFGRKTLDPKEFRASLWNLRQIYRSRGISKGSEDSMIKTTLTFGILKLITEQQKIIRSLPETIFLWNDWRDGTLDREIADTINDLTELPTYQHLKNCLYVDERLDAEACIKIKNEFSKYSLYGSDFDFFGLIYESLANKEIKKDFGEFYTPRHLIRTLVRLRLNDEKSPRAIKICDPACGTGGFLVEAFLFLQRNFELSGTLSKSTLKNLKENTFHGFDTNDKVAIPFARTNMLMADDGGINIRVTEDSLITLNENAYDYILTNVPYGKYDGKAPITNFTYTNSKRFELLFVEKILRALKPGGKAAVIVPDGLIESTSNDTFRKNLLLDAEIEAVISLPPFIFEPYTTEKTYVLFFKKKRPSEKGAYQKSPIYHFIVDDDGFQDGKKRYPINDNDLPLLEEVFKKRDIYKKAGFINITDVNADSYYSLCSEYYLRKIEPIEISLKEFENVLKTAEDLISKK